MKIRKRSITSTLVVAIAALALFSGLSNAQTPSETPPPPGEPRGFKLPDVRESTLPNGLKVVVVRKRDVPLVTASLLVRSGASKESSRKAGLASMTAAMLVKGAGFRNSTEIAQQIEFLGGNINTSADWNSSSATVGVMRDKLPLALSVMSDVVVRPTFPQKEVALMKKQSLDGFKVSLKQPGALLNLVAATYSYGEHAVRGTPTTLRRLSRRDLVAYHKRNYTPDNAVLIFVGDIAPKSAFGLARLFFGGWSGSGSEEAKPPAGVATLSQRPPTVSRILVVDLPASGQAAVGYVNRITAGRNTSKNDYYAATVLNSILGGGYSARLNQEIRLKRGLSYGARSGFSWRSLDSNFIAVAQTKNESAGEVAELIRIEIERLMNDTVAMDEMTPRKAVVTGGFGRSLQTNSGLARQLRGLYAFGLNANELNGYLDSVKSTDASIVRGFAANYLAGGDMIIVGDSKSFVEDLRQRFPDHDVTVVKASKINLNSRNLE